MGFILVGAGIALALPLLTVFTLAFSGNGLAESGLGIGKSIRTTLVLLGLVGVISLVLGVVPAWLVATKDFPLRRFLGWALVLPLAIPAYIMAYVYAEILDASGPLYSVGWVKAVFFQPDIYSIMGLAWVMSISLYPYVYLGARAGFAVRNRAEIDSARSLGASEGAILWRIILPKARPAIAAGLALALMETMADYGAADFLQVGTLTLGIFRAWHSYGDITQAAHLSLWLISIAVVLVFIERMSRVRSRSTQSKVAGAEESMRLDGLGVAASWGISVFLLGVLALGFIIPVGFLVVQLWQPTQVVLPLWQAVQATMVLGALGALATLCFALVLALGKNLQALRAAVRFIALLNYAQAGPILALGAVMGAIALFEGVSPVASVFVLIWVYVCRFANSGTEQLVAGSLRIPTHLHRAAHSLGHDGLAKIWRVDLPLILPSILAGGLVVAIEIMKELPATLILRPFGWDTLALLAHFYAKDEALAVAALPALLICVVGTLPIVILTRRLR